jgi:hypothetical protein
VQSLTNPYGLLPGGVSPFPFSYNPAAPQFILPASIYGVAPNFRWPYTYQFNFSIQRQIAKDWTVTAAYVGSLSHRLPFAEDLNYPYYNSTATSANVNNRRPIQPGTLAQIYSVQSVMNAAYHSLQVTAEKRLSHRISAKAFYTFSKALEDVQLDNNTTNGGAQDYRNLSEERGLSDNNRRHAMVSSIIWDLGYFNKVNPWVRAIVNNWSLSAIATLQSGGPFNVTTGSDTNLDGNNNDRVNLVGNPFLDPHRSRSDVTNAWFNAAAFTKGANGTDGTLGRNVMTGPGNRNIDIGLFRDFRIKERMVLQARGEFTNALNLVNLSNPNGTLSSALFGTIRGARDMRQVQMGLRLTY